MLGGFCLFFILFFAATVYAAVILIQIGGWLCILAGLLLLCSYFICGAAGFFGLAVAENEKRKKKEGMYK